MRGVATCFGANGELLQHEERNSVVWGDESVLLPQVICAKQALSHHATWKYLINLEEQDFSLRTNMDLGAALKALNGSNLVESYKLNKFTRWKNNKLLPQGVCAQLKHFTSTVILISNQHTFAIHCGVPSLNSNAGNDLLNVTVLT
uniref:Anaphase-promoting complex subunit 1 n=1 Tax=Mesocestoides corti TaxID=53468 RepID=A0A5K3G4N1_MESCO